MASSATGEERPDEETEALARAGLLGAADVWGPVAVGLSSALWNV